MPIEATKDFWRVRIRDPKKFSTFNTPKWAKVIAKSITGDDESKIILGKYKNSKKWGIQSILISKKNTSKAKAFKLAEKIQKRIESNPTSKKKKKPISKELQELRNHISNLLETRANDFSVKNLNRLFEMRDTMSKMLSGD